MTSEFADIANLAHQLEDAERDGQTLVAGLPEELAAWRPAPGAWSISECFDHLAVSNRAYLAAMNEPASRARGQGTLRRGPMKPGLLGAWFIRTLEPPVKRRMQAPARIVPRVSPPLSDAFPAFLTSHEEVRAFLSANADLDLTSIRFPNPFIRGLRFSLATGLNVIAAHERRHLWQAWRVRRAAEAAG